MASWSDGDFDPFVGARMGALVRFAYALTGDLGHAEDLIRIGKRVAFVAGGRLLPGTGTPTIEGQFSTAFELVVDGRAGADALISRLRP